ncbi:hypothetical protein VNO80_29327 [Phaseolus coccineus]|uniref:Uncharacterized protein n=1 Tax=Phaseolus coccineus TaxID=3886 RepID=A0AAN9LE57_PHACN
MLLHLIAVLNIRVLMSLYYYYCMLGLIFVLTSPVCFKRLILEGFLLQSTSCSKEVFLIMVVSGEEAALQL